VPNFADGGEFAEDLVAVLAIIEEEAEVMHPFTMTLKELLIRGLARDMLDEFDLGASRICDSNFELMIGRFAAKGLFGRATAENPRSRKNVALPSVR